MTNTMFKLRLSMLSICTIVIASSCGKTKLNVRKDKENEKQTDVGGFSAADAVATPTPAPAMIDGKFEFSGKESGKDCRRWAIRVTSPAKLLKLEAVRQEHSDGDIAYEGNQNTFTTTFTTRRQTDVVKFQTTAGAAVTLSGTSTPCDEKTSDDSFNQVLQAAKGQSALTNTKRTIQVSFK